jgi:hypothetical protein
MFCLPAIGLRWFQSGRKTTVSLTKKQKSGIPFRPLGVPSPNISKFGRKWDNGLMV